MMEKYRRNEVDVTAGRIQAIIADRDEAGGKIRRVQVGGRQVVVPSDIVAKFPGLGVGDYLVHFADRGEYRILPEAEFMRDFDVIVPQPGSVDRQVGVGGAVPQGESITDTSHAASGSSTGGSNGSENTADGGSAPQGESDTITTGSSTSSPTDGEKSATGAASGGISSQPSAESSGASSTVEPPADCAQ